MALGDILGGAASGALGGLGLGPYGALAGGLLGGLGGAFSGGKHDIFGTQPKSTQIDLFNQQQQDLISQLMGALTGQGGGPTGGILGNLTGEQGLDAFKQPALRTYFEEIVPGLAERFTGLGAQRSSAFQNALARSGENLARDLGEMRVQQQQALLGPLLSQVLSPQFTTLHQPGGLSGLGSLLGSLASPIGQTSGLELGRNLLDSRNSGV